MANRNGRSSTKSISSSGGAAAPAIINDIVESFNALMSEKLMDAKLKEFVGHTPLQVIAGILLGVVNALILFNAIL